MVDVVVLKCPRTSVNEVVSVHKEPSPGMVRALHEKTVLLAKRPVEESIVKKSPTVYKLIEKETILEKTVLNKSPIEESAVKKATINEPVKPSFELATHLNTPPSFPTWYILWTSILTSEGSCGVFWLCMRRMFDFEKPTNGLVRIPMTRNPQKNQQE